MRTKHLHDFLYCLMVEPMKYTFKFKDLQIHKKMEYVILKYLILTCINRHLYYLTK